MQSKCPIQRETAMTKGLHVLAPLVLVAALLGLHCGGGGSNTPSTAALTTAPTITSFLASPTLITAGQTATLTGVFGNGTGAITNNLDSTVVTMTSGTAVTVTPTTTTTYTLTVTASGLSVTQAATVTVTAATTATTAAAPVITAPASLATGLIGAVAITATVQDPTVVMAVDYQIDGADLGSAPAAPYTFTLPATGAYTSGQHVFRARSRDAAGNPIDPQFATNGYVYVYYTASSPTTHNRISRLTADPANPDQMLAGSELPLVDLPTLLATNHNGGALHFGPDGKLYAGVGNNAVNANSPSLATPLGKILRLNPDGTIPPDNPFIATTTGINQAIWAYGLRNPFTFAFQPGTTRMHINDVGENTWEEVNLGVAGANYGWPSTEGPTTAAGITGPIFAYGHTSLPPGQPASTGTFLPGSAIVGAAFDPPGSTWPAAYLGSYYFSDLVGGWVVRMQLASMTVSTFATGFGSIRNLAFGLDGALYVLTRAELQRITPP